MQNWINKKINPPILKEILVLCKKCNKQHVVYFDYNDYCLSEYCYEGGHQFTGASIDFDWYMPLPKPPTSEESLIASLKQDDNQPNPSACGLEDSSSRDHNSHPSQT